MAWDKGEFGRSGGIEHDLATFEECAEACAADEKCLQYVHNGEKCFLGLTVRLGQAKKSEDGKIWQSGWNESRIASWTAQQPPCEKVKFPVQN
jgi:hypothetical protein